MAQRGSIFIGVMSNRYDIGQYRGRQDGDTGQIHDL